VAIVDDDESVRRGMARLIAAYSLRVSAYASAREFLDSLPAEVPACLILDLQMPDMDGLQLLHHLAGNGPTIPTIVVTGNDEPGIRYRCEMAGAKACLAKPVRADVLLSAVQSVLAPERTTDPSRV
jgi:FixJ family two-component response regulator